jgi:hypothetical protein
MATLATNVHVTDERGTAHVFGPADDVPEWAQAAHHEPEGVGGGPRADRKSTHGARLR